MNMQHLKRKLLTSLALSPWLVGCRTAASIGTEKLTEAQRRLKGLGVTLVTDAVAGAEIYAIEFFAEQSEVPFYAKSLLRQNGREIMSFPGRVVPETVRVTWRKNDSEGYRDAAGRMRYSAPLVGDRTITVASRIPAAVIESIRKNGGGLRLKFRLKPDGVLFGWDIERFDGSLPQHSMPGGDFLQTKY